MPEPSNEGTRRKIYSSEGHLEGGAGVQWFGRRSGPVREQRCTICLVFRRGRVSMVLSSRTVPLMSAIVHDQPVAFRHRRISRVLIDVARRWILETATVE